MATGFDIDEEDYNWVDISMYADLDPTQGLPSVCWHLVIKRTTTIREITTSG